MSTYFGITIGPIFKTLGKARKTRELWAASYLFSYLMKQLIVALKKNHAVFVVPFTESLDLEGRPHNILEKSNGVGVFSDRCVFSFGEDSKLHLEEVSAVIKKVKEKLIEKMVQHLNHENKQINVEEATGYFSNYFQIYAVSKEFPRLTSKKDLVKSLYAHLDVLELQTNFNSREEQAYMEKFISRASFRHGSRASFLIQDALGDNKHQHTRFESIIEISARELVDGLSTEDKREFIESIGKEQSEETLMGFLADKNPKQFKTHHKYIAIVHIDGDDVGKCIKEMDDEKYLDFSEALMAYSLKTAKIISSYGGVPVYIGGDDALFFAPVRYGEKDIYMLIDQIDETFHKSLTEAGIINKPSLSAGISIAYYKHPLVENLERSRDMLFGMAKNFQFKKGKKNAVACLVQKHSGHQFDTVFQKNKNLQEPGAYTLFKKLVRCHVEDGQFLGSVMHHLARDRPLLEEIGDDPERVDHLIRQNYNEPAHSAAPIQMYLENLKKYIPALQKEYNREDKSKTLYGSLRIVKFLNREDND